MNRQCSSQLVTRPYIEGFVHSANQLNGLHLILIRLPSGTSECSVTIPKTCDRLEIVMKRSAILTYDAIQGALSKFFGYSSFQGALFAAKNNLRAQGTFKEDKVKFTACHFTVKVKPQFYSPGGVPIDPSHMFPIRHNNLSETIAFFMQDVNAVVETHNSMTFGQVKNLP